jgi:membrane protein YqaA with SNARE-associated domain
MVLWQRFAEALLRWGPEGLFVLSILDSAGLPIVGGVDAVLIAFAVDDPAQAYLAAAAATIGSLVGSLILFGIARKGGEVLLSKHISTRTGARLHLWFQRYGLATVFIPALSPLPLPMKIPVFCAGALQVRIAYFAAVVLSARAIRFFGLAYLGLHYGHQTFEFLTAHWARVAALAVGLAIMAIASLRLVQRHEAAKGRRE